MKLRYTHADLLRLFGEVDAIVLESEPTPNQEGLTDVVVYLETRHRRMEIIRALCTGEGVISHAVTRHGIAELFEEDDIKRLGGDS